MSLYRETIKIVRSRVKMFIEPIGECTPSLTNVQCFAMHVGRIRDVSRELGDKRSKNSVQVLGGVTKDLSGMRRWGVLVS